MSITIHNLLNKSCDDFPNIFDELIEFTIWKIITTRMSPEMSKKKLRNIVLKRIEKELDKWGATFEGDIGK